MTTLPPIPGKFGNLGVNPASGYFGPSWPSSGAIPQSFSVGGWTVENRGFAQQTFLGASIRNFTINGGFGDNSSSLSVDLVEDVYNVSDQTAAGFGDDIYHSGLLNVMGDRFNPPPVGSPVFFKFGENLATIEEAYKQTFDDIYRINTLPPRLPFPWTYRNPAVNYASTFGDVFHGTDQTGGIASIGNGVYLDTFDGTAIDLNAYLNNPAVKGRNHVVFGGILQSYIQNRGPGGSPLYSAQVIDPREILSNVTLILNNYSGTTFNNNNLLNIYGFLEYNPSIATENAIKNALPVESILTKYINTFGDSLNIVYDGYDVRSKASLSDIFNFPQPTSATSFPNIFPITGTGFSRRTSQGIPYYRVKAAVNALMGYEGDLPLEYKLQGFGGRINFRGFNYVVDFGSLPDIPGLYYLDFDQINLLDLVLEICDITSRDLFVSLLPVINHPACAYLNAYNRTVVPKDRVAGIIRLDTIDRSYQPDYGSIKKYIDSLQTSGIYVENQDVGFELSNITTDKFIVGAQQVDNYFFTTNADRDNLEAVSRTPRLNKAEKWKLETSFKQQLLPYYGKLGKNAVTIPKGFGAYQQILLDATSLNANGVGAYYVATEMELRCSLISFERWKEFLLQYNDVYLSSVESNDTFDAGVLLRSVPPPGAPPVQAISNNYAVTVPRSVFPGYGLYDYGLDKLPYSPCNPPYGYPLYYKRATKIGIPEAGLTRISDRITSIIDNYKLLSSADSSNYKSLLSSEWTRLRNSEFELSDFEKTYFNNIETALNSPNPQESVENAIFLMQEFLSSAAPVQASLGKIAKKNTENALKVYNFVRGVAEECLGKKFLVKIPKSTNLYYSPTILTNGTINEYTAGPFGFKPIPNNSGIGYQFTTEFISQIDAAKSAALGLATVPYMNVMQTHLHSGVPEFFQGSLKVNYNPVEDKHEYNYEPVNDGGFFDFDLYSNVLSGSNSRAVVNAGMAYFSNGVKQSLIPTDLNKFINENGRVSAYVRFDHSEYLSFENINSDEFIQEVITVDGKILDLSDSLDNVKGNQDFSFFNFNNEPNLQPQIAFVKCQVDDKFYMPPKCIYQNIPVHGRQVIARPTHIPPRKIYDPCKDEYSDSYSFYHSVFIPKATGESPTPVLLFDYYLPQMNGLNILNSYLIKTSLSDLDTNNVYALITLPGRVIPTKDARYRDSILQINNPEEFKRFMTMDTVDAQLPGFDKPAMLGNPPASVNLVGAPVDAVNQAWFASRKALSNLSYAFPNQVKLAMPSPVYPDLICLPLMSKERCYGPWISSQTDIQSIVYSNIGGKIEFIKDENLAPWNYDGYSLMNEAGLLQAKFGHSLLLQSERGGFVVPGLPPAVSLGKSLLNLGPLVTNLQIDVSDAGVRTTVKMELYTASFGKLQKQKQDEISKLSRERQKLKDERNSLIRKGLGKGQTSRNYMSEYDYINSRINTPPPPSASSALGNIVISVNSSSEDRWSSNPLVGTGGVHKTNNYNQVGSIQSFEDVGKTSQAFLTQEDSAKAYYNTASASVSQLFAGASMSPGHANMPSNPGSRDVQKELDRLFIKQQQNPKEQDT